ncbi:MAG: GlmU family protein [Pseudarcicella sp.]|nr:GlmU family protein [Pseudarcicella sp.]MBP6410343.1 GlmU family protein [Pseudarcicella sp.]
MLQYLLFDDFSIRQHLLPLAFTRPISYFRIGILTIKEKWECEFNNTFSVVTEEYLAPKFPTNLGADNIFINASLLPNDSLKASIEHLQAQEVLTQNGKILAYRSSKVLSPESINNLTNIDFKEKITFIASNTAIFSENGEEIKNDFERITKHRTSQAINDPYTAVYQKENIFIEEGCDIKASVLDASTGPIYIGKKATIQAGSLIQGPFAICEGSTVNLGAKIRPNTTIGPFCKVGGEVNNAVFFGNSNKGHDGFMGNAVIGEWCNWGADSNNSNLKNDYSKVELWNYQSNTYEKTELQFVGIIMGDHSKCGINTMFNTGTVVGVNCNIFGADFQPKHIPSFSWGGAEGFRTYHPRKAFQVAKAAMERRNVTFDEKEEAILSAVFELTRETKED